MITPITLDAAQNTFDAFAQQFSMLVNQAGDLGDWGTANLTDANLAAGLLLGNGGQPLTAAQLASLKDFFATIGKFASWANTANAAIGGVTPAAYFRANRRAVR